MKTGVLLENTHENENSVSNQIGAGISASGSSGGAFIGVQRTLISETGSACSSPQ